MRQQFHIQQACPHAFFHNEGQVITCTASHCAAALLMAQTNEWFTHIVKICSGFLQSVLRNTPHYTHLTQFTTCTQPQVSHHSLADMNSLALQGARLTCENHVRLHNKRHGLTVCFGCAVALVVSAASCPEVEPFPWPLFSCEASGNPCINFHKGRNSTSNNPVFSPTSDHSYIRCVTFQNVLFDDQRCLVVR